MHTAENKTSNTVSASNNNASGNTPFFQAKFMINKPGDMYEQEADAMADNVMRMPINDQPFFSSKPVGISQVQRKCAHCAEEEKLQRKESTPQPTEASSETSSYINSLSSKGSPLPESARSFFEPRFGYDFSDVKIHNDSEAAKSADSINALAYTSGNNIVFNQNQFSSERDGGKKLLAHELTHVVQQKSKSQTSNIHLKRKPKHKIVPVSRKEALDTVHALAFVLSTLQSGHDPDLPDFESDRVIKTAPERFQSDLNILWQIIQSELSSEIQYDSNAEAITGQHRIKLFYAVNADLATITPFLPTDADFTEWLNKNVSDLLMLVEQPIELDEREQSYVEAMDRVNNSVIVDQHIIEIPDDSNPHQQAELLRSQLPKILKTITDANEQITRMAGDTVAMLEEDLKGIKDKISHHEFEKFEESNSESVHEGIIENLETFQGLLYAADVYLKLTDKEFQSQLSKIQSDFKGATTFSDLLKFAVEIAGGSVSLTSVLAFGIAKLSGDAELASAALGVASQPIHIIGNVIAGIDIIHGIFTILDSGSSSEDKLEGGVEAAEGGAYLIGGIQYSLPLFLTFQMVQFFADEYWQFQLGAAEAYATDTFQNMQESAQGISKLNDELIRTGMLKQLPDDDFRRTQALDKLEENLTAQLSTSIDSFLSDCEPVSFVPGAATYPGSMKILVEIFAPLMPLRKAKNTLEVKQAAISVLETIKWCFLNVNDIVAAESQGLSLSELKNFQAKRETKDSEDGD